MDTPHNGKVNNYLFPALESLPGLLEKELLGIDQTRWDSPTHPERFTPREVIAHLADWEPILLDRIKTGVSHPGATIAAFDEVQMAVDNDYASIDPMQSLASWKDSRSATIAALKELQPSDWKKTVIHPERGELTVDDIANMIACHDVYHLRQLSEANR